MKKLEINFENYWDCLDDKFDELINKGYVKLPSIASLDLNQISERILSQISDKTYTELNDEHKIFIGKLLLDKYLAPKLFDFAQREFGYKGQISNQYHVARSAIPGEKKYRAHFDSHIFTLVIPLRIPEVNSKNDSIGELMYFPNMRVFPKNELTDFIGKLWTKQYSSQSGIKKLAKKKKMNVNKTLLIVDDSRVSRMMISMKVKARKPNWNLIEAEDGNIALKMAKENNIDFFSLKSLPFNAVSLSAANLLYLSSLHINLEYPLSLKPFESTDVSTW